MDTDHETQLGWPWKRQRKLKKEDIPSQQEIIELAQRYQNPQHRALFILAYLTGGRITEIVRLDKLRKHEYRYQPDLDKHGKVVYRIARNKNGSPIIEKCTKVKINYPGIRKRDLVLTTMKEKKVLIVSMQNRKNKNYTRKRIPIPVERERELVKMLLSYAIDLPDEAPLFPFKEGKARNILKKVDMNPHFLRDIRLTHLVTIYDFNAFQLTKFAGWQNVKPAERYVRLGVTDLVDKY